MKTNYRPRNSTLDSNRKRVGLVVMIVVLAVLLFSVLRNPLTNLVSPLWRGSNTFSRTLGGAITLVRSKESLENQNENLQAELSSYNTLLVSSRALEDSRDQILANFNRASTTPGIAASVLVHPPETPYDILIIDVGTSDGVDVGDTVWLPEGASIGEVSNVSDEEARVTLYSSSATKTDAILERNTLPVTLIGQGGGNFEFDLPKGVAVSVGDKILSPNIRSEMIAVVGDVESDPTDSLQHVFARSVADVFTLHFVLVKP